MKLPSGKLILASRSPRRQQLLREAGYQFEICYQSEEDECEVWSDANPAQLVARLAYQKAADVARQLQEGIILSCDTVVECNGQILGKPRDGLHARQMLQILSGRE